MKRCTKCLILKDISEFNRQKASKDGHQSICRNCDGVRSTKYSREVRGNLSMSENKQCPGYLGIAIAERLVRHLFKDVVRMPNNNSGYDIICSKDKKIDVKSACITMNRKKYPFWQFSINKNKIADYFLLLAFNNRVDIMPQYLWLVPGYVLNNLTGTGISPSTIYKWNEWKQPIGQTLSCCNEMKNGLKHRGDLVV